MDVLSSSAESTDPEAEVRRLRRQLRRERALRQAAETVGARATAHLHDSVRGMRSTQADLLERADQDRVVDELSQALREDLDSAHLVNRAAESVGRSTGVDRCDVLLVDAERFSAVRGTWSSSEEMAALPRPGSFVDLPEALTTLLLEAAQHLEPVQVDDVDQDDRLGVLRCRGDRRVPRCPLAGSRPGGGRRRGGGLAPAAVAAAPDLAGLRAGDVRRSGARPRVLADAAARLRAAARVGAPAPGARPGQGRVRLHGLPRAAHPADEHRRLSRAVERGWPRAGARRRLPGVVDHRAQRGPVA